MCTPLEPTEWGDWEGTLGGFPEREHLRISQPAMPEGRTGLGHRAMSWASWVPSTRVIGRNSGYVLYLKFLTLPHSSLLFHSSLTHNLPSPGTQSLQKYTLLPPWWSQLGQTQLSLITGPWFASGLSHYLAVSGVQGSHCWATRNSACTVWGLSSVGLASF